MKGLFRLTGSDFAKGLVMAVLGGAWLPFSFAALSPDFSIATANWGQMLFLITNGAIVGFVSYLNKNFFSTSNGKVGGKIG